MSKPRTVGLAMLGDYVKKLRVERGMGLKEFAKRAGLSVGTVRKLEANDPVAKDYKNPDMLNKLGKILHADPLTLMQLSRRCPHCHGTGRWNVRALQQK